MNALGLNHLTNILYREDKLTERTRLVFKWVNEKELTQEEFDVLISYCNNESIVRNKQRRYGEENILKFELKTVAPIGDVVKKQSLRVEISPYDSMIHNRLFLHIGDYVYKLNNEGKILEK